MKQNTFHQFEIRVHLVKYLTEAKSKIHLSIGWLDDNGIEGLLQKKSLEGVEVVLILIKDEDYKKSSSSFDQLKNKGVQIIELDETHREQLIDHKFGIIDSSVVLTGNYSWGYRISPMDDFITVTEGVPTLATGFEMEFEYFRILNQLSRKETKPPNPIIRLLKKLEVVKVLLRIGDTKYIHLRLRELKKFSEDKNIELIHRTLRKKAFDEALYLITKFIECHEYLRESVDPPIDIFRREIRLLEDEIARISNEYNETEKSLHKFSKLHTDTLGDLLQKILFQNKIKAEKEAKGDASKQEDYEEAKKDHEEYTKSHEQAKKQKLTVLSSKEQKELKKLYRQTSLKCHPDRVVEELHDQAEEIFVELNQAYKANDLERVREISQQLKTGMMLSKSEGITELKKLESTFKNLNQKLQDWQSKLDELQAMPTFKTVSGIEDWDVYFKETKGVLKEQLERLIQFNKAHATEEEE